MTEKLLKEAVQLCLDNVEQYIKDAQLLVENGSYGHAFALAVLSEEELSKAYIYHACSEGLLPEDIVKRVGRTRESHIRKQAIAGAFTLSYKFVEFMQSIVKSSWEQAGPDLKKRRQIVHEKLKETMDNIRKNKDKLRHRIFEFMERVATLEKDKQKGLYVDVDIAQVVLHSPKLLKKDQVEKHLGQVKELFEFSRPLLMLTLPPSERKRAKAFLTKSGILEDFLNVF